MTAPAARDKWAAWLLERRHGGDPEALAATLDRLGRVRERVLDAAAVNDGDVVLDVGCGDGLIAFGAVERVGEAGRVVFSDISEDLLDVCRERAAELGVSDRCEFVLAPAEDLAPVADASVDVVTTRSVVIYLPFDDKQRAFEEFFRVLRPGGRLSVWEPINRFASCTHEFWGIDAGPVLPLLEKLYSVEPDEDATLVDFDERDLLVFAERAGFAEIRLEYEARIERRALSWDAGHSSWETFIRTAPNPRVPTLEEAMASALTPEERAEFEAYIRPRFEAREGTSRSAFALLRALKA